MVTVTILAIAAVWIGLYYWDAIRVQLGKQPDDPHALFEELCRAHGLARAERDALSQVAAACRLSQPAVVFVDPRHLRETGDPALSAALSARLFGDAAGP